MVSALTDLLRRRGHTGATFQRNRTGFDNAGRFQQTFTLSLRIVGSGSQIAVILVHMCVIEVLVIQPGILQILVVSVFWPEFFFQVIDNTVDGHQCGNIVNIDPMRFVVLEQCRVHPIKHFSKGVVFGEVDQGL